MATFCPGMTSAENPWMISLSGEYPKWTSRNSTCPSTWSSLTAFPDSSSISGSSRNPNTLSAAAATDCIETMAWDIWVRGWVNRRT